MLTQTSPSLQLTHIIFPVVMSTGGVVNVTPCVVVVVVTVTDLFVVVGTNAFVVVVDVGACVVVVVVGACVVVVGACVVGLESTAER